MVLSRPAVLLIPQTDAANIGGISPTLAIYTILKFALTPNLAIRIKTGSKLISFHKKKRQRVPIMENRNPAWSDLMTPNLLIMKNPANKSAATSDT